MSMIVLSMFNCLYTSLQPKSKNDTWSEKELAKVLKQTDVPGKQLEKDKTSKSASSSKSSKEKVSSKSSSKDKSDQQKVSSKDKEKKDKVINTPGLLS